MNVDEIAEKLNHFGLDYKAVKGENESLKEELAIYQDITKSQQEKLNHIYESTAKAHYEAELWERRFKKTKSYIENRLEFTPASIPYRNVHVYMSTVSKQDLNIKEDKQ